KLTRILTKAAVGFYDKDGDGYPKKAMLGLKVDCDDKNAAINPDAKEEPDNGIDDNCEGGDAKRTVVADPGAGKEPAAGAQPRFKWDGNVLLIGIDTLRADRIGASGQPTGKYAGGSLTPSIDALAAKGA